MSDFLSPALVLSAAGVALTFSVLYYQSNLGQRASVIIAISFGMLTYLYLLDHHVVLDSAVEQIALAVVGALVALALFVRKNVS
ncbi:MAG: hypothetical protein L3J16_06530 [Anaerolineales bacterium]|nr:hypothetical protein [Anaerolineales bacterium]